jgi:hypothetical protein
MLLHDCVALSANGSATIRVFSSIGNLAIGTFGIFHLFRAYSFDVPLTNLPYPIDQEYRKVLRGGMNLIITRAIITVTRVLKIVERPGSFIKPYLLKIKDFP